jgi:glycosyltransferase involved in cell wall biosynthesis
MAGILTIIPYAPLPLRGGGALRSFHLLRQLARFHEVHAIIFQREAELRAGMDGYRVPDAVHIYSPLDRPPPPTLFDRLPRRLAPALHYRWLRRSWRGPAEGTLLRCHHLLSEILTSQTIDAVHFEHLSTMMAAPLVRRLSPKTFRILDAHNVDHLLGPRMAAVAGAAQSSSNQRSQRQIEWHEKHLARSVHAVWACSEEDRAVFAAFNRIPIEVVPNGVDLSSRPFDERPDKAAASEVLFVGSLNYPPNLDGLRWFVDEIWPRIRAARPDTRLTVVGRGGSAEELASVRNAPGVDLIGEVADVAPYYRRAGVFVCPLREGSGTRLKILESMAFGNPVVSTRIGAEGIQAEPGRDLLIADVPQHFADAVVDLITNPARFDSIRHHGRALVEGRYDWDLIGDRAAESIALWSDQRAKHARHAVSTGRQSANV